MAAAERAVGEIACRPVQQRTESSPALELYSAIAYSAMEDDSGRPTAAAVDEVVLEVAARRLPKLELRVAWRNCRVAWRNCQRRLQFASQTKPPDRDLHVSSI